jgi:outer membrane protein assembly factor BamB
MKLAHRSLPALLALATIVVAATSVPAADWPQWRGPNRDGISQEKGLLQRWPQEGPKLVWKATDIGSGYSTPAVVGDRLYLLASEGLENEFVTAISASDGKRIWSTRLGNVGQPNQMPNFAAARSTPTVEGDLLYALGSDGDLACLDTDSGKIRWRKHLRSDFGGKPGPWAYAESPLIDGDTLGPGGCRGKALPPGSRLPVVL